MINLGGCGCVVFRSENIVKFIFFRNILIFLIKVLFYNLYFILK